MEVKSPSCFSSSSYRCIEPSTVSKRLNEDNETHETLLRFPGLQDVKKDGGRVHTGTGPSRKLIKVFPGPREYE